MYGYIAKGAIAGHLLTRRLLRTLTGIPGMVIDGFLAIFWAPNYLSYWDNAVISYSDGVQVTLFRGIFGWLGEILGYALGSVVGATIGLAAFFIDTALSLVQLLQKNIYNYLDRFALFVGENAFFDSLLVFDQPNNYMQKIWNIGAALIGGLLSLPCTAPFKLLEYFFPFLGNDLSRIATGFCGYIGGVLLGVTAIPVYPVAYVLKKTMDLYTSVHDAIRHGIAILYGVTGEKPDEDRGGDCLPAGSLHSPEFRREVIQAQNSSWTTLLLGLSKKEKPSALINSDIAQEREEDTGDRDLITAELLGARGLPTVTCPYGHSFNDDARDPARAHGIRFWVQQHHTCPLDRQEITENDLHPNLTLDAILHAHQQ